MEKYALKFTPNKNTKYDSLALFKCFFDLFYFSILLKNISLEYTTFKT